MSDSIEQSLETLLRGEIAAAETYKQVLEGDLDQSTEPLRDIQGDHGEAIKFLYERMTARGLEPPTSSGAWGLVARAVEGTAKLVGDRAALAALREGERKGLELYEQALALGRLPLECRGYVEEVLVPAQCRHIEVLSRLIDAA